MNSKQPKKFEESKTPSFQKPKSLTSISTNTPKTTTTPTEPSSNEQEMFNLDVCFLIDTTGSMQPSINMARNKIKEIISGLKAQYTDSVVRIAVVSYKDDGDKNQHQVFEFSSQVEDAHRFLGKLEATGGGDYPEDVNGGFRKLLGLKWQKLTTKMLYHLADAPCHGKQFHNSNDGHPNGLKGDEPWDKLLKTLYIKDINYLFYDIGGSNKKMFDEFKKIFDGSGPEKSHIMFSYEVFIIEKSFNLNGEISEIYGITNVRNKMKESKPMKMAQVSSISTKLSNFRGAAMISSLDKVEIKAPEYEERFVESTVSNARCQMMKNIAYQKNSKI